MIAVANGWDETRRLAILPSCLTQYAYQLLEEIPETTRNTWATLKTTMGAKMVTGDKHTLWSLQLRSAKRKQGESQAAFFLRLRKLVIRAYPNLAAPERESRIKECYIMGQPPELQLYLLRLPPANSMTEVIEAAKRHDAAQEVVQSHKAINTTGRTMVDLEGLTLEEKEVATVSHPGYQSPGPRQLPQTQPQQQPRGAEGGAPQSRAPPPILCYRCRRTGHMARECPEPMTGQNRGTQGMKCYECQQVGHMARQCPNRGNARGQGNNDGSTGPANCYRCNNKGHQAKDCRTNIDLKCNQCGKLGHMEAQCRVRTQFTGAIPRFSGMQQRVNVLQEKGGVCMACGISPAYCQCDCGGYYCSPVCQRRDAERHSVQCGPTTKNEQGPTPAGNAWDED